MTPLLPETHGHLGWRRFAGFGFARRRALQPLALDEIRWVAQGIPVMFRRAQGHRGDSPHAGVSR